MTKPVLIVCVCLSTATNIKAQNESDLLRPFQQDVLQIGAKPENVGGVDDGPSYIGFSSAFLGEGQLTDATAGKKMVKFSVYPSGNQVNSRTPDKLVYPENQWLSQRIYENISVHSGTLKEGDLVPLFGWLYEIDSFTVPPLAFEGVDIILKKTRISQWPDRIALDPYAYPVVNEGIIHLAPGGVRVTITVQFQKESEQYELKVIRAYRKTDNSGFVRHEDKVLVKRGTLINVKNVWGLQFKVVSVVPPNTKNKIPGWVELRRVWPSIKPYGIDETGQLKN